MENGQLAGVQRLLDRIFVERELFVRANDKVRYLRLSPRLQQIFVAVCFVGLGWVTYSSLGVLFQSHAITAKDEEIQLQKLAYLDLLTDVAEYQEQFARLSESLDSNQALLLEQLEAAPSGDVDTAAIKRQLDSAENERSVVASSGSALRKKLAAVEGALGGLAEQGDALRDKVSETQERLDASGDDGAEMAAAREFIGQRLRRLERDLAEAHDKGLELQTALESVTEELTRARNGEESLHAENEKLRTGMARFERKLERAQVRQVEFETTIAELETTRDAALLDKEQLEAERIRLTAQVSELEKDLSTSTARQAELTQEIAGLEVELRESVDRADSLDGERKQYQKATLELGERLQAAVAERAELDETIGELQSALAETHERARHLEGANDLYEKRVAELEQNLLTADGEQVMLSERVASLQEFLSTEQERGDRLTQERNFYETRVASLEQRLDDMRDMQQTMVKRLSEKTMTSMDAIEKTVAMTGVDINFLLSNVALEAGASGQGGPFVPGDYISETDPSYELQASVALLDLQMDRWEALQKVLRQLPLVAPLDTYRLSSGFGTRKDPINGRKARHLGLDFTAPLRSPVLTTAPGKVVFAGWRGRYGRMIEIDHGLGVHTRYAHLKKILVKPGEEVVHREQIGLLGSSGRSTGPHVHYEILVDGKPVDPSKFLEAGRHVFKG